MIQYSYKRGAVMAEIIPVEPDKVMLDWDYLVFFYFAPSLGGFFYGFELIKFRKMVFV